MQVVKKAYVYVWKTEKEKREAGKEVRGEKFRTGTLGRGSWIGWMRLFILALILSSTSLLLPLVVATSTIR
jgi:hypothetical protein